MKILFLSDDLLQGGAERQLCLLAAGLKRRGHDIEIVLFYDSPVFYSETLENAGIGVMRLDRGEKFSGRIRGILETVRDSKPDVVVSFKESSNIAACAAAILKPFPLIVSERNITVAIDFRQRLKFLLYRTASAVVSNNHSQARFINRRFIQLRKKLHVITNTLPPEFLLTPKRRKTLARPVVLTLARISPQKNILRYIEAVAKAVETGIDARFIWCGRAESEVLFREAGNLIRKHSLEKVIQLRREKTDTLSLYDNATHFFLPSLHEGFSNVLCEAMARGLVVVAGDVADNGLIIDDSRRLFNPLDTDDMAAVLSDTLSLTEIDYNRESQRNICRARQLCGEESFLDAYETLLKSHLIKNEA